MDLVYLKSKIEAKKCLEIFKDLTGKPGKVWKNISA